MSTTALAARIAHPALFAHADDIVEAVAAAFPVEGRKPSRRVDVSDPVQRQQLLRRIQIADLLDQGYSPARAGALLHLSDAELAAAVGAATTAHFAALAASA